MKLPIDEPHVAVLKSLGDALSELQIKAVLIGGVAISLVVQARYTRDVDVLVMLDTADVSRLIEGTKGHYFTPLFHDAAEFAVSARVAPLKHLPTGITVDVALGCMPFEAEVIARARPFPIPEIGILLPTSEDLVICL